MTYIICLHQISIIPLSAGGKVNVTGWNLGKLSVLQSQLYYKISLLQKIQVWNYEFEEQLILFLLFVLDGQNVVKCLKNDLTIYGEKVEKGQDVIVKEGQNVTLSLCTGGKSDDCDIDLNDQPICEVEENSTK